MVDSVTYLASITDTGHRFDCLHQNWQTDLQSIPPTDLTIPEHNLFPFSPLIYSPRPNTKAPGADLYSPE